MGCVRSTSEGEGVVLRDMRGAVRESKGGLGVV